MESQTDTINLSLPSHPKNLQLIRSTIEKVATSAGFSHEESSKIVLAIDEACANIIKHSYKNNYTGKIDLTLHIEKDALKIRIVDYGSSLDFEKLKPRDIDDIRPGGLGLYIINEVMDSVEFNCPSKGRNEITMIKKIGTKKT